MPDTLTTLKYPSWYSYKICGLSLYHWWAQWHSDQLNYTQENSTMTRKCEKTCEC